MNKKILSCAITGALVMSCVSTGVSAATKPVQSSNASIQSQSQQFTTKASTMKVINMVNEFGSYLKFNSNKEFYLTKTASQLGVTQTEYDNFMKGVQLENEAIKKGELTLVLDKQGNVTDVKSNLKIKLITGEKPITPNLSMYNHWYGWQLKLTEGETTGLIKALGVGSAGAWFAAELAAAGVITIPASIPLGIIASACGLTGAAIYAIDQGYGISIFFNEDARIGWVWAN